MGGKQVPSVWGEAEKYLWGEELLVVESPSARKGASSSFSNFSKIEYFSSFR